MAGITNLDRLLKEMKPELVNEKYVFCTLSQDKFDKLQFSPKMVFIEK